jgi:hypothetical protein
MGIGHDGLDIMAVGGKLTPPAPISAREEEPGSRVA